MNIDTRPHAQRPGARRDGAGARAIAQHTRASPVPGDRTDGNASTEPGAEGARAGRSSIPAEPPRPGESIEQGRVYSSNQHAQDAQHGGKSAWGVGD